MDIESVTEKNSVEYKTAAEVPFLIWYANKAIIVTLDQLQAFKDAAATATAPEWYYFGLTGVLLGAGVPVIFEPDVAPHEKGVFYIDYRNYAGDGFFDAMEPGIQLS
ncbi:hypothetical protein B0I08_102178 [Glaciihabitans tibetensis]|uniref:Uncharacterized protein n=1 Tax=Glaciihabitans tibetensis TaxID=1266600 RepID=A0A2T0VHF5_9MICO|nr:hypothetical protein [Glaciihabitans tibetensis]PRY69503.1 hypothetical protein B0I08_102178 [Glaciihabitans tibetensis]